MNVMPTGDEKVDLFHRIKSREKWHGFVLEVPDADSRLRVQRELDVMLGENGYDSAKVHGERISLKGTFNEEEIHQLKSIIDKYKCDYSHNPIHARGTYFDFLLDYWVDESVEKFRTH